MVRYFFLVLFLFAVAAPLSAQDAPEQRRVVLTDGTVLIGIIVDENADPLVIVTANGIEQHIPRDRVAEITPLYAGRFTRLDPNRTRLFLAPTGRSLGRGTGRFSAYAIIPSVAYGVTDRIDVSAGVMIPLVADDEFATAISMNAKAQLVRIGEGGGIALGVNAVIPIGGEVNSTGVFGTFYAVATLGSETSAATLGAFGFYGTDLEDFAVGEGAAFLLGFEQQISSSVKIITENYILVSEETGGLISAGVRFFGDRLAADIAVVAVVTGDEFFLSPIPYVGFAYNFGR